MSVSTDTSATELPAVPMCVPEKPYSYGKRLFDLTAAIACLLFIFPVFLFIAVAIKITDGGRIFYSHRRVGLAGREFGCWKFRTMVQNGDEVLAAYLAKHPDAAEEWIATRKLKSDPRVTAIGRILRKLSLDEIPQLFNIVKGEMSLVGPRPIVADEVSMYGKNAHLYFRVRPGLTGLWQISGRSELTYDERVEFDCRYVESHTLAGDMMIILRTIPAVCMARGSC